MPHTQAHFFILQIKRIELRFYVVWTPGWKKWIPVSEMLKAEQKYFEIPPPIGHIEEDTKEITKTITINTKSGSFNTEKTYTQINLDSLPPLADDEFQPEKVNWDKTPISPVLAKENGADRRIYKRFPHRIELVIMTKAGRSFRSSSINISIGGALLREPVPTEFLKDIMDLLIINPFPDKDTPSHLLVKGRVVGDTRDTRRLMFYDVSPEVQDKMRSILDRYQKNYKSHKKKKSA